MTKHEFLSQVQALLKGLPREDVERSLEFYTEMIEDSMEEGLDEAASVAKLGPPELIAQTIRQNMAAERPKKSIGTGARRWQVWQIVLIALGSPIWISLVAAIFAVILSFYVTLWAVAVSFWAVFVSFAACVLMGLFLFVMRLAEGALLSGLCYLGLALVSAGLCWPTFYGCFKGTVGLAKLSKITFRGILRLFRKGERI